MKISLKKQVICLFVAVLTASFSIVNAQVTLVGTWVEGLTHAKEEGNNRALVVILHAEQGNTGAITTSGVTYGGQTMTKVGETSVTNGSFYSYTGAYVLNNVGITAATSEAIAVTWNTPPSGTRIESAFFINVNQNPMVGVSATKTMTNIAAIAITELANTAGDMIIVSETAANDGLFSYNQAFTKAYEANQSSIGGLGAGYMQATGVAVTPSLTNATNPQSRLAMQGFVLVKSTGTTPTTTTDIVAPVNKIVVTSGSNVTITALATMAVGRTVSSVVFKDGSTVIAGSITTSGNNYSIDYLTPADGTHLITAIITDDQATEYTSPVRTFYVGTYIGNKYAQSDITWATGPWYNDPIGGVVVGAPGIGDNVFTQNKLITIGADVTCNNLTFGDATSVSANKITISGAYTLTVRGLIDCITNGDVDVLGSSNIGSTIKLTGEAIPAGVGPFTLISDNAVRSVRPKNLSVDLQDARAYQIPATNTGTVNVANSASGNAATCGKLTVAKGNVTIKSNTMIGQTTTSELIVAAGATLSLGNLRANLNLNPIYVGTKATINGTLISTGNFAVNELVLGANAVFQTNQATRTDALTWDGWWGNGGTVTLPTPAYGQFATPTTVTLNPNSTIEFNKVGNQNINAVVPENKMYLTSTSALAASITPSFTIGYANLKLSGSGTKTVQSNLTFTGTLDVATGVTLVIPTGVTLTVAAGGKITNAGTITNNGIINFMSDATNGTATVINTGTMSGSGTTNINQFLTTGRNWYIANPVASVSPTMVSGTIALNGYDEQTVVNGAGTWAITTNPLVVGKGYVASVSADGNVTFTGTLNNGNQNIALSSRTGTANKAGFNLIGNPYPSYLDWSLVTANSANSALLRSNTLWYRTKKLNQLSQLVYQFQTVNGDGVSVPNDGNAIIPPMQSFWVRAVENVASPIVVTNAMRAHAPASDKLLKAPTAKKTERTLVRLQVSNGVNADETLIYYSVNASNDQDNYDAPKMFENKVEVPEIFTTAESERMVINAMNCIQLDSPIGIGFIPGNATSFSIKANEITNLPEGVKLILKDNVTLAETDLTDGATSYVFSPEVTSNDRFSVIFRSTGATTNIKNELSKSFTAHYNDNRLVVTCDDTQLIGSTVLIYNSIGQLVNAKRLTNSKMQIDGTFVPGVYVLKVNNNNTIKVIVN